MDFKAYSASRDLTTLLGHPTSGFEIRPQAHERSFFKIEMSAYLFIGNLVGYGLALYRGHISISLDLYMWGRSDGPTGNIFFFLLLSCFSYNF